MSERTIPAQTGLVRKMSQASLTLRYLIGVYSVDNGGHTMMTPTILGSYQSNFFNVVKQFTFRKMSKSTKVTQIDRQAAKLIRERADAALKKELAKFGIRVESLRGTFSPTEFKLRYSFTTDRPTKSKKEVASDAQHKWNLYCRGYGLTPSQFGKSFKMRNSTYTVTGITPRRHKYPVDAENQNGSKFKLSADMIGMHINPTK